MRDSCLQCARKHISESEVLMREALMGYPEHAYLAVGHLSQAEAELLKEFPEMAHIIRTERINYLEGLKHQILNDENGDEYLNLEAEYEVDTIGLIRQLTMVAIGYSIQQPLPPKS